MTAHDILLQLTLFCCFFIPETLTVNLVGCGTYEEEITVPYEHFDFRPFAGENYQNSLRCRWTFYTPNNFSITFVQFTVFHLQSKGWWSCSDHLMVSLLNTSSGNVLNGWGPMCDNDKPPDTSIHPGEKLVITFRSDNSITRPGFELVAFSTVPKKCDEAICPTIQVSYAQGTPFSSYTGLYNYAGEFNGRPSYTQQHGGATIRYIQGVVDMMWALVDSANYIQAYSNDTKYQCPYGIPKISWFLWNSNGSEKVDIASDLNISCNSRCTPLRTPNNAELVFRGDDTVGSSTVFRCLDNYTMLGDSRRVCLQNSTWSGEELDCKADCMQPENGYNSQIRTNSLRYLEEDVILYDCLSGFFYSSGNRQRVCQPNRTWSGEPLHCTEGCKFPNPGNNSVVSASNKSMHYPIGSSVTYQCLKGFVPFAGNQTRTCLSTTAWSGTSLSCNPIIPSCQFPSPGNNSLVSPEDEYYPVGSNVTYQCLKGFVQFAGNQIRTCLSTTAWSGMSLICIVPTSKEAESMKADIQTAAIASAIAVLIVIGIIIAVFLIRRRLAQNSEDEHSDSKFTNSQHPSVAVNDKSPYSNEICLEELRATESGNKATTETPIPSQNQARSPSPNFDDSYEKLNKRTRQDQDAHLYTAFCESQNLTDETGENEYYLNIESDTSTAQQPDIYQNITN